MPDLLLGLRIVLTRPAGHNEALAARIQAAGGEVLVMPLLAIAPPACPVAADALLVQLAQADTIIFISPNAVRMACAVLPAAHWPQEKRWAAIGKGTAQALHQAGVVDVLTPEHGAESEGLLALAEFNQLAGQDVLLVRGEGGRELLAHTLIERGAQVDHAVVYRRLACPLDKEALRQFAAGQRLLMVITSSEALRVLMDAGDAAWLRTQDFLWAHPRIAQQAALLGLNHGMIAPSPEDDAVFAALLKYARQPPPNTPESLP